jgi:hypothetical protein
MRGAYTCKRTHAWDVGVSLAKAKMQVTNDARGLRIGGNGSVCGISFSLSAQEELRFIDCMPRRSRLSWAELGGLYCRDTKCVSVGFTLHPWRNVPIVESRSKCSNSAILAFSLFAS